MVPIKADMKDESMVSRTVVALDVPTASPVVDLMGVLLDGKMAEQLVEIGVAWKVAWKVGTKDRR